MTTPIPIPTDQDQFIQTPSPRPAPKPIVYLVVGPQGCGKTTFLQKLTRTDPSKPHPPHLPFIVTNKNPRSHGRSPELHFYEDHLPWSPSPSFPSSSDLSDLSRVDFHDHSMPISADEEHSDSPSLIILCFDIGNRSHLETTKYLATGLQSHYTLTSPPILLLGLNRDLRTSSLSPSANPTDPDFILPTEGLNLAQSLALTRYMECSSFTGEFLQEVSEDIVDEGIKRRMAEIAAREDGGSILGDESGGLGNCIMS